MAARNKQTPVGRSARNESEHVGDDPQTRDTAAVVISGVLIAIVAVIIAIALLVWS